MSTGTDVQRQIRQARISRALFTVAAVLLLAALAQHLASGALVLAAMNGLAVVLFAASVVLATARIRLLRKTLARELARPRMTLEDYRHLREMEAGLGWELSEVPADVTVTTPARPRKEPPQASEYHVRAAKPVEPPSPSRPGACTHPLNERAHARPAGKYRMLECCGVCGELMPGEPKARQAQRRARQAPAPRRPAATASELAASPLSGTGSLSARWDGATRAAGAPGYHERAAEHFAALARVGREHCASYCPICLYRLFGPMPDGVKPDESISMWRWTEENWGWKR